MYRVNPLLVPAIAFACGIFLSPHLETSVLIVCVALCVSLLAVVISRFRGYYVPFLCIFAGIGIEMGMRPGARPQLDAAPGETLLLRGCVVEPPAMSEARDQFVMELEPGARVRVTRYRKDEADPGIALRYGQRAELEAKVRPPRNFGNPGAFDFESYLARREIFWTATVPGSATISVLSGDCGNRAMSMLYGIRVWLLDRVRRLYAGDDYAVGILQALLVGEAARMDREWADMFRRTGTYHAIVVSGLHVTTIAMAIALLLRMVAPHSRKALAVTLAAVWIYAGMCGWQAPVLRSAAGYSLFAAGRLFFRECRLLNLLAALALLFLVLAPWQMEEASFQLTFFSVLALGALAIPAAEATTAPLRRGLADLGDAAKDAHLDPRAAAFRIEMRLISEALWLVLHLPVRAGNLLIRVIAPMVFWIWETFLVSAAMQIGLALPMVLYFHRMSISGVTANLIVTPLLTLAVPTGLFAVATGWAWPVQCTGALVRLAGSIAGWHAHWEPNWRVPDPPLWLGVALAACLILLAVWRKRLLLIPVLSLLVLMVWHPFDARHEKGSIELTMLDVGQGESLLVGFPSGQWMLVDGGGIPVFGKRPVSTRMDIGEDVVSPYLLSRGIRRIDVVVSTHQHDDHAAGLSAVMDNFRPGELWVGATPDSETWKGLTQTAARLGVRVVAMSRPDRREIGGVKIDILSPYPGYEPRQTPSNDDSLVLRLAYGEHRFLLTGDVERQAEHAMLDAVGPATVLKVAHHGSKTSSGDAFLDIVQPRIAFISAGKDNLFHHPHAEVLQRLGRRHTAVFRTDEWGLVSVRSDGKRLRMESNRWRTSD